VSLFLSVMSVQTCQRIQLSLAEPHSGTPSLHTCAERLYRTSDVTKRTGWQLHSEPNAAFVWGLVLRPRGKIGGHQVAQSPTNGGESVTMLREVELSEASGVDRFAVLHGGDFGVGFGAVGVGELGAVEVCFGEHDLVVVAAVGVGVV
jgi:hypothetical protein